MPVGRRMASNTGDDLEIHHWFLESKPHSLVLNFFREKQCSPPHLLTVVRTGYASAIEIYNCLFIYILYSSKQNENDTSRLLAQRHEGDGIWRGSLEILISPGFLFGVCRIIFPSLTSVSPLATLTFMSISSRGTGVRLNRKGPGLLHRPQAEQLHSYQFCKVRAHKRLCSNKVSAVVKEA